MSVERSAAGDLSSDPASRPLRIVHFVTGGGTGSTRVALDLAIAQLDDPGLRPHLLLRRKGKHPPLPLVREIEASGLPHDWIENSFPRSRVIREIAQRCTDLGAEIFFAHGYSEHLWGRRAAIQAQTPLIVHVEHNEERYLPWRLLSARRLARKTAVTVCVSSGVRESVLRLGIGSERIEVIHNGINTNRFQCDTPHAERSPDIVMAARFAGKKDQETLIRAARILVDRGWGGRLLLAGGGKKRHRSRCRRLAADLALTDRVAFLGPVEDLPTLFGRSRVAALSSRQEGFGLVLVEAMAAGCAVVASRIPGITDVVEEGRNGWLFPPREPEAAADALAAALSLNEETLQRIRVGREVAETIFSTAAMARRYRTLLNSLLRIP